MPEITIPDNIQTVHILSEGKLVIRNAAKIKNELLIALEGSQNLVVVLKDVIKIDLTIIQLLIGLQKSAGSHGKKVSFCFGQATNEIPACAGMTNPACAGMTNPACAGMTNPACARMTNPACAGMTDDKALPEHIRPLLEYSGFGEILNEHFKNAA